MSDANTNSILYTTGEVAKLCGVSVRTVQYYDTRGILVPSELTDGGRRLYSEHDVKQMKTICFLREVGLPINTIGELLAEDDPGSVISIIMDEQEKALLAELNEIEAKLDMLDGIRRGLKSTDNFSVESIGDIAHIMENRKKMRKLRAFLLITGIPVTILEWAAIILWIATGIWWPFVLYTMVAIPYGIFISRYYFKRVAYICPSCHTVFKPSLKEAFFANHTPTTRKLTCTSCGHKGFCVETIAEEKE